MGTASTYSGPSNSNPLIPSWLDAEPGDSGTDLVTPIVTPNRFRTARANFSRFASSGGSDHDSLRRSFRSYVSTGSGGATTASRRMGAARVLGGGLLGFLNSAAAEGAQQALVLFNLTAFVGRPIQDIFLGLLDAIFPEGGRLDEAIARPAFIDTIADFSDAGIVDFENLTIAQMQTVFELYLSHTVERRVCADIGANLVKLPPSPGDAHRVQAQLEEFIRGGIADAVAGLADQLGTIPSSQIALIVDNAYTQAFAFLSALAEEDPR